MSERFSLKPISPEAVGAAIEKAEHYRLLNDPEQAESICLDVLHTEPENQRALVVLVLALTDQFAKPGGGTKVQIARAQLERLAVEYQRVYYAGLIAEREGRAFLARGMAKGSAYECFREALERYARAQTLRPPGNDDAVLRWNSCVRTISSEGLSPAHPERELPLE